MFRRKPRRLFDEFFRDIDDEFMMMDDFVSDILSNMSERGEASDMGPFIYGFSMRTGADGRPIINEFGNLPSIYSQQTGEGEIVEPLRINEREPLVDVMEKDEHVKVIAELPGVEKKDIKLNVFDSTLSIRVDTPDVKYSKDMELPAEVKPDTTKAKYKNGILEVIMEKLKKENKEDKGWNVKVD